MSSRSRCRRSIRGDRIGGHPGVMQDFVARDRRRHRAGDARRRQHQEPRDGLRRDRKRRDRPPRRRSPPEGALTDAEPASRHPHRHHGAGPTSTIRPPMSAQILPLGFESIQPFFWQTLGGKDIPRLAGEIREAIGDADVDRRRARHVRQSAGGRADIDRETLAGWETLHRQRASFRRRHASPASPAASAASR